MPLLSKSLYKYSSYPYFLFNFAGTQKALLLRTYYFYTSRQQFQSHIQIISFPAIYKRHLSNVET